jgi:hypothetical protein
MTNDYEFKELKEHFETLPDELQEAITSVDVAAKVQDIGRKHRLRIDELDEVYEEAGLVLLGLTHPGDFVGNLRKRLAAYDSATVNAIAEDVNKEVFEGVRESLRALHDASSEPVHAPESSNTSMNRNDILRAIEDPALDRPRYQAPPASRSAPVSSAVPPPSASEIPPVPSVQPAPLAQEPAAAATDIAESKLSGTVRSPIEEVRVDAKAGTITRTDPYREPVE